MAAALGIDKVPIPFSQSQIPIYINKVISVRKICFRFLDYMEDYVSLLSQMKRYYGNKENLNYISSLVGNEEAIKAKLFILKRDDVDVYHRVAVKEIWDKNMFFVELLDEGFDYLASEKELIVNENPDFQNKLAQGFTYSLDLKYPDEKNFYVINYALQKLVIMKSNFFIQLASGNDGITLFYRDQQKLANINDFLLSHLKSASKIEDAENTVDAHVNSIIDFVKKSPEGKNIGQVAFSTDSMVSSVPIFKIPPGELDMKCKHVFNPSDFYLKLKKNSEFVAYLKDLNDYYAQNPPRNHIPVLVNSLYITNYKNKWTRLLILGSVSSEEANKYYSCLLFDKGVVGTINDEDIFELDERFKKMPPRSVKGSLAFVKSTAEKWTREANDFFKSQVKSPQLSVFEISFDKNVLYCSLVNGCGNMADLLNERGYAQIDF